MLRRAGIRQDIFLKERNKAHRAWMDDFKEKNGRIPSLQEDIFSFMDGLESLTNGLLPRNQRR
jgi:hypothetical protein